MQDVFDEQPNQEPRQGETQPEQQPQEAQATEQLQPGQEAAPPAADTGKHVPLEALEAERKGRQDWKEKAIRYEEELKQLREQQQRPQQQPQDPLVSMQQQIINERFNFSEMVLRQAHQDVDENVKLFQEAARQNPALTAQMMASQHPWKFAYDEGKRLRFAAEIGTDPDAYRKKLRAEIEAEIRGQGAPSPQSQQPAAPGIPQSLAGARSAGARGTTFTGPTPMDTIFPN